MYNCIGLSWVKEDCEVCKPSSGGASLTCGQSSAHDTSVAFEFVLALYFVKPGKIEFLYRKDSVSESGGWTSGTFTFYKDDDLLLKDMDTGDSSSDWKYFSANISSGMKSLTFLYQKYNS